MTIFIQKTGFIVMVGLLPLLFSSTAYSAGCQINYGWNKGNSLQGTFENKSKTINLSKGQTKTINKDRMNYVKNLKNRNVKFYLKNAQDVTLGKNQRNPVVGTYVGTVKLKKVKCSGASSSSSLPGERAPGPSVMDCLTGGQPKDRAPAPFAPSPRPNTLQQNCKP